MSDPEAPAPHRQNGEHELPLFIPLRAEFYEAFASGAKTEELRRYGPRWNERTCRIGRRVVLSRGYGKAQRLTGVIVRFKQQHGVTFGSTYKASIKRIYGTLDVSIACISITVDQRAAAVSRLQPQPIDNKEDRGTRVDRECSPEGPLTASQNKLVSAIQGLDYQGQWQALIHAMIVGTNTETANDVARVVDAAFEWEKELDAARLPPAPAPQREEKKEDTDTRGVSVPGSAALGSTASKGQG